jgi:hypothetical protein
MVVFARPHRIKTLNEIYGLMMNKKPYLTFILSVVFVSACTTGSKMTTKEFLHAEPVPVCEHYQTIGVQKASIQLDEQIYQFQEDIERSLVLREKTVEQLSNFDKKLLQNKPVSPDKLNRLNQAVVQGFDLMKPVVATMIKNHCWYELESSDVPDHLRLKGVMLSLAASISLYDDYQAIFILVNENDRLRRFIDQADSGYDKKTDTLEKLTNQFVDIENLSRVRDLMALYENKKFLLEDLTKNDKNMEYLLKVIGNSSSYILISKLDFKGIVDHRSSTRRRIISDTLIEINRSSVNAVSGGFSNVVGSYESRKGLLYGDHELEIRITKQLQPGDILLEKTPFRLTDSMIPGHFGHAAIWIGNEQELKDLGLWNKPRLKKYHPQITQGHLIAESLRSGTTLSTLSHFLNVDDVAVLRSRKPLTENEKRNVILLALRQLGKEYDFNFDVETTDKIVCSQLVYLSYEKIEWPTERVIGRYTISPDNIAVKALDEGPLELLLFYHNGKLIEDDPLGLMQNLMVQ